MPHHAISEHTQYVLERDRREAELERSRQRRHEEPVQQRTQQVAPASDDYWAEVDRRIAAKFDLVIEAVGQALGDLLDKQHESIQAALDKRDAKIQELRDEVEIKIGLGRKLARLKAEVAEARQQAPDFKSELHDLRETVTKQQKTIVRLRGEQSSLAYEQRQLDMQLSKMKRESASPAAVVQFETSSSRFTVGNLHPDAANALREFASQVVDAWDGDAILFSDAGTA
jgi:chromosome segregation ATPase